MKCDMCGGPAAARKVGLSMQVTGGYVCGGYLVRNTEKETFHPVTDSGRYLCSPAHPMPPGAVGQWEHEDAHEVADDRDEYAQMKCNTCGQIWWEEIAQ